MNSLALLRESFGRRAFALAAAALAAAVAPAPARAMPDFLCSKTSIHAASFRRDLMGTELMMSLSQVNIFGIDRPAQGDDVTAFVVSRKCPLSSDLEFETWVLPHLNKGSPWVPLAGGLESLKESATWWVVGPKAASLEALMRSNGERRLVKLQFPPKWAADVEAGRIGGITVSGLEVQWKVMRKGDKVTRPDGSSGEVAEDLAGLAIAMTLTGTGSYPRTFYLQASDGELLATADYTCRTCAGLVKGEARRVTLTTGMGSRALLKAKPPAYLVNPRTGLRLPLQLPAMP